MVAFIELGDFFRVAASAIPRGDDDADPSIAVFECIGVAFLRLMAFVTADIRAKMF